MNDRIGPFYGLCYKYIYICGHTSSYMSMLDSSLLGNEKLRGQVVHNVGEVKKKAGLARSPSVFTEHISSTYTCNHFAAPKRR